MVTKQEIEIALAGQTDGSLFCPRCGRKSMDPKLHKNALSRVANVYICSTCGLEEALDSMFGIQRPFEEWDIVAKQ